MKSYFVVILLNMLATSDYKPMKCYEMSVVGKGLPHDGVKLHEEQQRVKDRIEELERLK